MTGGCLKSASGDQVWSLTQFYYVYFSKSRNAKSAFSTNAQSRFASASVDGVLGPPCLVSDGVLVSL